ncbi:type II toxin-antitoxin system Xre/ParS family antitoxin [Paracidovorax avenae]|uniref:type II RES/Xre toxin-antitoxin system antitoxin n=1 Tax=Paracidovorax avenae TaxID=80867 RepID=UPI0006B37970|nr:antitoxin Xre/MbcA/ParS toxin-binding domain-containing protein [Paracidovorax avenae]
MSTKQSSATHPRTSEYWLGMDEHIISGISAKQRESYRPLIDANGTYLVIALELLGGHKVFSHTPRNLLDVHRWVSHGIPSASISNLAHAVEPLPSQTLSEALGVSLRTLHRKKGTQSETLSVAQGGRTFKFAEVVAKATLTLGSREAAVQWLTSPAMGLDQQKPVDLLATPVGTQLVEELLDRIEYGVYA